MPISIALPIRPNFRTRLEDAAENALVLVEWAERAGEILAADRLEVHLATTGLPVLAAALRSPGMAAFAARLPARQIQDVLIAQASARRAAITCWWTLPCGL